jgi:hypothetical protein
LCPGCHAVKTKRFMAKKSEFDAKIKRFGQSNNGSDSEDDSENEPEFKAYDSGSESEDEFQDNREKFANEYNDAQKIKTFKIIKVYTCNECNETFNDEYDYENHLNDEYKCKVCNPNKIASRYTCDRCKRGFNRKQIYDAHINRKYKCEKVYEPEIISPTIQIIKKHVCIDCGNEFGRSNDLLRHRKDRCKGLPVPVIQTDKITDLLEKMNRLEKEISRMKSSHSKKI